MADGLKSVTETKKRGTQEAQELMCRRCVAALRKGLSRTQVAEACGVSVQAARGRKLTQSVDHLRVDHRKEGTFVMPLACGLELPG